MTQLEPGIVRTKELPFGIVTLREDDILTFKPSNARTINLEELQLLLDTFIEITEGKRRKFLSDNRGYEYLGYSERKFIGDNLHKFALASAIIENNAFVRFIGNTIKTFFAPKVPMEMFNTEEDAVEWLHSI